MKIPTRILTILGAILIASIPDARGEQEGDYTYSIKDNTVLISKFTGKGAAATVPKTVKTLPVTSIEANTFLGSKDLTSVSLPEGVSSIGETAFGDCEKLVKVSIPASAATIGNHAFRGCPKLLSIDVAAANPNYRSVDGILFDKLQTILIKYPSGKKGSYTISDSVISIGRAFSFCEGLTGLVIGKGVASVEVRALAGCKNLLSVTIGENMASIANSAFLQCENLTSIAFGSGVTSIGETAFQECKKLTNVIIPANVISIDYGAFADCTGLKSVTFKGNAPKLGDKAFAGTSPSFGILYTKNSTGFTSPTWNGYPAVKVDAR